MARRAKGEGSLYQAKDDHKRVSVAKLGDIYSAKPEQKEPAPAPEDETNQMEMKMGW